MYIYFNIILLTLLTLYKKEHDCRLYSAIMLDFLINTQGIKSQN